MGVVMGIVALLTVIAAPSLSRLFASQRLTDSALAVNAALSFARGEAIRTGDVHLVYFRVDETGATLEQPAGTPVDILVVNDGRLGTGNQNCSRDIGEQVTVFDLEDGVTFGVSDASAPVATDTGLSTISNGSTFEDGTGSSTSHVMFRTEGPAYGFKADCTMGAVGSGGGGVYVTNGDRDVAVVVTPLGSARMHRWTGGGWTN
jgi:Tfp pilus assembly protein FimT